jgi:hypothetical protein
MKIKYAGEVAIWYKDIKMFPGHYYLSGTEIVTGWLSLHLHMSMKREETGPIKEQYMFTCKKISTIIFPCELQSQVHVDRCAVQVYLLAHV